MSVERVLEISDSQRLRGLARPGGTMIIASYIGMLMLGAIGGIIGHGQTVTGVPALILFAVLLIAVTLNIKGYIAYGKSKGYSGWLSFWLFTAQTSGLIVLLLLPDNTARDE